MLLDRWVAHASTHALALSCIVPRARFIVITVFIYEEVTLQRIVPPVSLLYPPAIVWISVSMESQLLNGSATFLYLWLQLVGAVKRMRNIHLLSSLFMEKVKNIQSLEFASSDVSLASLCQTAMTERLIQAWWLMNYTLNDCGSLMIYFAFYCIALNFPLYVPLPLDNFIPRFFKKTFGLNPYFFFWKS